MTGTIDPNLPRAAWPRRRGLRVLKVLILVPLAIAVVGGSVMLLWNWLLPPLTGWHTLDFPRALGLLVLCRLLFGGWRGGGWRHRLRERYAPLSPEERERVRAGLHRHCQSWHERPERTP